jgi:hypothetical protein
MARPISRSCGIMISPGLDRLSRNRAKCAGMVLPVMGNQNPAALCRFVKDVGIWYTDNPCRAGILEIDAPLTAAKAKNDLVVEVCVSLEPRPHALGLGAPCRAASSFE